LAYPHLPQKVRYEIQKAKQNRHPMKLVRLGLSFNIPFVFNIYSVYGTVTVSFGDIIAQLDRAYNDLADLAGYVGNFVNWWNDMKIGLGCLQSSISFIKPDRFNPLRQEVVLKQWKKFREQNVQYQRRVCEIQCHYFQLS